MAMEATPLVETFLKEQRREELKVSKTKSEKLAELVEVKASISPFSLNANIIHLQCFSAGTIFFNLKGELREEENMKQTVICERDDSFVV